MCSRRQNVLINTPNLYTTDKNNLFTSLWAYGNFPHGIRVAISLKNVVFIWISTKVLVIPVGVSVVLVAVVFVRTLPHCLAGAFMKWLVFTCSVFKNSTCKQLFQLFVSLYCFWYLLPKLFAIKIFFFGITQTCFSIWILLLRYFS